MRNKTLYAKDSVGNVLEWHIEIFPKSNNEADLFMSYGRLGGNKTLKWERNIQGKNIGKSNETNSIEQAEKQLESRVKDKKKRGYLDILEEDMRILEYASSEELEKYLKEYLPENRLDEEGFIKPMKANQYFKSKKNWIDPYGQIWKDRKYFYLQNPYEPKEKGAIAIDFPCFIQPKINGVRAFIYFTEEGIKVKSKEGKSYNTLHHIEDFSNLNNDMFEYEGQELIFDGELYIHGEALQDISSAVKAANINTPRVKFVLFDLAIEGYTTLQRLTIIKNHIKPKLNENTPIESIKTFIVNKDFTTQMLTQKFIEEGYEGSILRSKEEEYQFGKRTKYMVKLKRLISHDFTIKGVIPQPKNKKLGMYVCSYKGKTFKINPTQSEEYKALLLLNKGEYIGKKLQCSFYEWTNDNKPFHIIETTVRDYE